MTSPTQVTQARWHARHYQPTANLPRWSIAFADIDEAVVTRLIAGEPVTYTAFERREAVQRLRTAGMSLTGIAVRLRIGQRQVCRDLRRTAVIDEMRAAGYVTVPFPGGGSR